MEKKDHDKAPKEIFYDKYFLLGILSIITILLFWFLSAFMSTLFIAAICAVAMHPMQRLLYYKFHWNKSSAALGSMLTLIVAVLIPISFLIFFLISNAEFALSQINNSLRGIVNGEIKLPRLDTEYSFIQRILDDSVAQININTEDIVSSLSGILGTITKITMEYASGIVKNMTLAVLHAFMFILALYYFLKDGKQLIGYIQSLLPISEGSQQQLFSRMYHMLRSITIGILGGAMAQGTMLWLGLSFTGVENAAFWAFLGALLSPIPYIGIGLIWVPIVVVLFIRGEMSMAWILLSWCVVVVVNIDNVVKPYLIGKTTNLHPFAVMLAIFGGILTFGFQGLLFGPFVLLVALCLFDIYKKEFASHLRQSNDPIPLLKKLSHTKKHPREIIAKRWKGSWWKKVKKSLDS